MPSPGDDPATSGGAPRSQSWQRTLHLTLRATDDAWKAMPAATAPGGPRPSLGGCALPEALRGDAPTGERYRLDDALGAGATSAVWAAFDQRLRRPLAIKVLEHGVGDRDAVGAFLQEARTSALLQHPNVLPVHDVDVAADGRPYFTMHRVHGRSLAAAIEASTPERRDPALADVNAVVSSIIGVANAVSYAHHQRIVHQDIKPANIMLGEFGEVLLVDWGSAQPLDRPTRSVYGTPLYMSPEQARREPSDQRSDVHCLGATLFHALTLRPPTLPDDDEDRFWERKRRGEIDPPTAEERRRVPAPLLAIALKAMAAQPARRYASIDAMLADLRSFQGGLAVSAHAESLAQRLRRWCARHRRSFAVALPAALCVATLAGLLYGQRAKQVAFWGAPVLAGDALSDPSLAAWKPVSGGFVARDGALVSTGAAENLLVLRRHLEGDIAIEYDAWFAPGARSGDLSVMLWPTPDPPRDAQRQIDYDRAFQVQFGAMDGAHSMITVGSHVSYATARAEPGRRYHVRVEFRDDTVSLAVDGRTVCSRSDELPLSGGYLSLYAYFAGKCFANLRVYVRHVPQLVPSTAVGDVLLRSGQFDLAASEYARVIEAHPGSELAAEASFRAGLARWRQGDHAAADALWRDIDRPRWRDEVELERLGDDVDHRRYDAVLDAIDRLARERPRLLPRLADAWCTAIESLRHEPHEPASRALAERALRLREERLAAIDGTAVEAPSALLFLERWDDVLRRFPDQPKACIDALMALGRPDLVLERYPRSPGACWAAALASARYELLPATGLMGDGPVEENQAVRLDREALPTRAGDDDELRIDAGEFADLLPNSAWPWWPRAMVVAGRAAEVPESTASRHVGVLLAQGRLDDALRVGEAQPAWYAWPRFVRGMRAAIAGDMAEARAWFAIPPQRRFTQLEIEPARTLLLPFLDELAGDRGAVERACARTLAERRWVDKQRPWHLARYLLGQIDDDGFRAQPYRRFLEADLRLARAVRAERDGRPADAVADYRAWSALPPCRRGVFLDPVTIEFVAWRLRALDASR